MTTDRNDSQLPAEKKERAMRRDKERCQLCDWPAVEIHHLLRSVNDDISFPELLYRVGGWRNIPDDSQLRRLKRISGHRNNIPRTLRNLIRESDEGVDVMINLIAICSDCHVRRWGYHAEQQRKGTLREMEMILTEMVYPVVRSTDFPNRIANPKRKLDQLTEKGLLYRTRPGKPYVYGLKTADLWSSGPLTGAEEAFVNMVDVEKGRLFVNGVEVREGMPVDSHEMWLKMGGNSLSEPAETNEQELATNF